MATGEAYAFFDCLLSMDDIERELPNIRDIANSFCYESLLDGH